ncbi:MAG: hypothetical protein JEZ00_15380 [Anaerolineaceae bacterium]|nr:hypothetical protein [Anaerolineaceae bacterium]
MKKKLSLILIFCFLLVFSAAFTPDPQADEPPIFFDDFESYLTNTQLGAAYTVWEDGALMRVSIEKGYLISGDQALRVDSIGVNQNTHTTSGSIYHLLQPGENNWQEGIGMRLWIYNLSKSPLSFTVNFKEKYNEFWAVGDNGQFFLQTEDGNFIQQDIQFGNLQIPAFYHGYVFIPFESFTVPTWNTAKGDEIMDLSAIDSFSLGINVTVSELQRFIIDDIEVVSNSNIQPPVITGNKIINIPESGQHQEYFQSSLPNEENLSFVSKNWSIINADETIASIDNDGWLTIPGDINPGVITILNTTIADEVKINTLFDIQIIDPGAALAITDDSQISEEILLIQEENSAYQKFSDDFETWASENRAWFVVITISLLLVLIASLSIIQSRLK